MDINKAKNTAKEIVDLFLSKGGSDYAGEEITQLEHASQAAMLAEQDGQDDEVILAALLHDIGHLLEDDKMGGYGAIDHEGLGAAYLSERGFSEKVATLVKSHVAAKRYLCYANQRYFENLSEASKATLAYQGGPMTAEEAQEFESNPLRNLIIKMRSWDETAKEKNIPVTDMTRIGEKIVQHLMR